MTTEKLAFICSHIFDKSRPVLLVSREGGDWQFLCGGEHPADELPHVVGMHHLLDFDPSLREILDLPSGHEAERGSTEAPWIRTDSTSKN